MKKNNLILLIVICLLGHISFAQSKIEFKDSKPKGEGRVVYFQISKIKNQEHLNDISLALSSDKNISSCNIYKDFEKKDACQLEIKNLNIDANYIRNILRLKEVDFDMASVLTGDAKRHDGMPEHYPVFVDTGKPETDKAKYDNDKKNWLKSYPKEVEALMGKSYYEVVSGESFYMDEMPVFIDTGNKVLDESKFEKRKLVWNKTHSLKK